MEAKAPLSTVPGLFRSAFFSLLLVAAVAFAPSRLRAADVTPIPLAQEDSDLKPDPAVTWGLLDNGLRYAIMPNAEPPDRVSLRLYVDAGSLMETDDQQGLAHFLEHMAFNGTDNFPSGEMVEYFQRLGMAFGSHTNAHTSFHETVYKLELPNTDPDIIDQSLLLLRDYANRMKLPAPEIDRERGVILSEKRARDSVGWRTFMEQIDFALPDSLLSHRLPIGTEEVIKNAPRERFENFYNTWYTSDRMAVVVVGDIDVADMEKRIKDFFTDLPAPEKDVPEPDLGKLTERGFAVHYYHDDEAGETTISFDSHKPITPEPDTAARRARDLRYNLAAMMLNRRLGILAKKADSVIISGNAHAYDLFDLNFAQYGSLEVECDPENWKAAFNLAEQELRRSIEFGFTEAELREATAKIANAYDNAALKVNTRQSKDLANSIAERLGQRRVFTSPVDDVDRVKAELDKVTTEECRQLWASLWDSKENLLFVSGNLKLDGDPVETLTAAYEASKAIAVEPPAEVEDQAFAYTDLPAPGEIADRKVDEDLEIVQLALKNGVRVNYKSTEFEDNTIQVYARIGAGKLTEPKDQPGLSIFLGEVFEQGGLEAHSYDDLQTLFAGKTVDVSFAVEDDAFVLSGRTTPADLRDELLLLRAYLTAPGFREEAASQFARQIPPYYQQLEHTPQGLMQLKATRFLHGGDPRFGFPEQEVLLQRTLDEARAWVTPALENGYLELTLVGDLEGSAVETAVTEVFGSLPQREAEKPAYTEERKVSFPDTPVTERYEFETTIPKALVLVYWKTDDIWDIQKTRRLGMLSSIMDDRLRVKVREELGDAYSPFAHHIASDVFTDYGYFFAFTEVDPSQTEKVAAVVAEIAKDLAAGNITEDELERAKKPLITQLEEARRQNRYWLGSVMASSQEYPQRLEWAQTFIPDHEAITLDELKELAAQYLSDGKAAEILIMPVVEETSEGKTDGSPEKASSASN